MTLNMMALTEEQEATFIKLRSSLLYLYDVNSKSFSNKNEKSL